jgi:hypothetical protein
VPLWHGGWHGFGALFAVSRNTRGESLLSNANSSNWRTSMRIIELVISPQGDVTLQTKGYQGSTCQQASKFLEQALGIVTADFKSSEHFQLQPMQQSVQQ